MTAQFDGQASTYEADVDRSISFSGMEHGFFTRAKVDVLLELAAALGGAERVSALDVGCGVGSTDTLLAGRFRALAGTDISQKQVKVAAAANPTVSYTVGDGTSLPYPPESFDLVFTICVLHHVPVADRAAFVGELRRVTRKGGRMVIIEHNPLNPLTRLAVTRCAFDEDAVLLGRREAERLLTGVGAPSPHSRYILFFPSERPALRRAERRLGRLPLGAQYVTWATR